MARLPATQETGWRSACAFWSHSLRFRYHWKKFLCKNVIVRDFHDLFHDKLLCFRQFFELFESESWDSLRFCYFLRQRFFPTLRANRVPICFDDAPVCRGGCSQLVPCSGCSAHTCCGLRLLVASGPESVGPTLPPPRSWKRLRRSSVA